MFTIIAFSEACAAIDTVYTIDSVPDDHVKNEGDAIVVPELNKLLGAYAIGDDIYKVQLISPSLRRVALLDISPVEDGVVPADPPDPIFHGKGCIDLDIDEELTAEAGQDSTTTSTQVSVLGFLGDGNYDFPSGKIHTVKATLAGTVVAYTWGSVTMTLSQSLPVGNYAIVGARLESSTVIGFRFVFIGGIWRPGMVACASKSAKDVPLSRMGGMGVWGKFAHNREPGIELFSSSTAGASTLYIDLMKV